MPLARTERASGWLIRGDSKLIAALIAVQLVLFKRMRSGEVA